MLSKLFNWRILLSFIAILIVSATIFFTNFLSKKIASEEKVKIEQWVEALNDAADPNSIQTNLTTKVLTENNTDIPIIFTNENDSVLSIYNLDTALLKSDKAFLIKKLAALKAGNEPIVWINPQNNNEKNIVYYGESKLLKEIKYFPLVQLFVVALFIIITLLAINTKNKSTQNQVWAGMAKETAHQLGTPITSLQGWLEVLKEEQVAPKVVVEISKDIERLKLVSDRFGKIGSKPQLEPYNVLEQVQNMVNYIKRRAPEKVSFSVKANEENEIEGLINAPLFDWVIENLLKNALDAMDGQGSIEVELKNEVAQIIIDVKDSGKGISRNNISQVFKPGFSTKKRGWGLGLSLSKRIIDQYHKGSLFVKQSELGKGTTFRIILKK